MDERCLEEIRQDEEQRMRKRIARLRYEEEHADDLRDAELYDNYEEDSQNGNII